MAFKVCSRLAALGWIRHQTSACGSLSSGCAFMVKHDRQNLRVTGSVSSAGPPEGAVLLYRFTGENEVDLMSTFVPEAFRGRGVAALLSQAAIDFLVEEKLRAHVSCWYVKKYMEEHPDDQCRDLLIS
uniref:Protein NATD1 n=1 Tax=Takifugu rubripes TaxID=31033 RepID=A0A674PKZ9_TAKRU